MGNPYEYGGNYRNKLFEHYGLKPADYNDFVVHHIDMNRKNCDISNLILLPRRLHAQYHNALRHLGCTDIGTTTSIDLRINLDNFSEENKGLNKLMRFANEYNQIRQELEIWFALKKCRDFLAEHK